MKIQQIRMLENDMFNYGRLATIFVICNKTFIVANDFYFLFYSTFSWVEWHNTMHFLKFRRIHKNNITIEFKES
jgi:hypothetical protein